MLVRFRTLQSGFHGTTNKRSSSTYRKAVLGQDGGGSGVVTVEHLSKWSISSVLVRTAVSTPSVQTLTTSTPFTPGVKALEKKFAARKIDLFVLAKVFHDVRVFDEMVKEARQQPIIVCRQQVVSRTWCGGWWGASDAWLGGGQSSECLTLSHHTSDSCASLIVARLTQC
jgi:hypothetical protein